uniref:Uncharacterized protein n=1 Tax=Tetraselmis sp. GSL018 TaxID=582737 RepID=A0A061SEW8_9CHLO
MAVFPVECIPHPMWKRTGSLKVPSPYQTGLLPFANT